MHGHGHLEMDGPQIHATVTVNGVVSKMSLVEHDGALHLFSPVRNIPDDPVIPEVVHSVGQWNDVESEST